MKMGGAKAPSHWRLAMMAYTFRDFPMCEGIDKTKALDLKYLEEFSWHKVGGPFGDAVFNDTASAEAVSLNTASPNGPPTLCHENSSRYLRSRALVLSMPSHIGKSRKV